MTNRRPSGTDMTEIERLCDLHRRMSLCFEGATGEAPPARPRPFEPQWSDLETLLDALVAIKPRSPTPQPPVGEVEGKSLGDGRYIRALEGVMNNPIARTALEPELYDEILSLTAACGRVPIDATPPPVEPDAVTTMPKPLLERINDRIESLETIAPGGMVRDENGKWSIMSVSRVASADARLLREIVAALQPSEGITEQ